MVIVMKPKATKEEIAGVEKLLKILISVFTSQKALNGPL